jgi:hypothetical protein
MFKGFICSICALVTVDVALLLHKFVPEFNLYALLSMFGFIFFVGAYFCLCFVRATGFTDTSSTHLNYGSVSASDIASVSYPNDAIRDA